MGSYQYVYGRRVWAKRVASLCGVIVLVGVAGCSSSSDRMGYYGSRDAYGATGAVPVPPEPVYGQGNGYRYGGNPYTAASNNGGDYANYGGQRRAPFAYSEYQNSSSVQRTSLAPVSGYDGRSYGSSSYAKSAAPVNRYAANDTASYDGGGAYAMQVTNSHNGGSSAGNRGYAASNRNNGYNNGDDNNNREQVPVDDFRSRYRSYENDGRYGAPVRNESRQYQPGQYANGAVSNGSYTVQTGDTVYSIAQRFRMTTAELSELNGLRGAEIHPGQRLRVNSQGYQGQGNSGQGYTASNAPSWQQQGKRGSNNGAAQQRGYGDERYGNGATASYNNDSRNTRNDDRDYRDQRGYASANPRGYDDGTPKRQYKASAPEYTTYTGHNGQKNATVYTVSRGDTVFDIARRNGISHRELADYNDISPNAKLYPGQRLHIPAGRGYDWGAEQQMAKHGGQQVSERRQERTTASNTSQRPVTARTQKASRPVAVAEVRANQPEITGGPGTRTAMVAPETAQAVSERHEETSGPGEHLGPRECEAMLANPAQRSAKMFREPVSGAVISKFGPKEDGSFNDGVNFSVPKGTPVKAAENGVVAYAGDELTGFGNLVLIRHADGFVTAYANNDELMVKRCDVVKRGQTIGKAGATGNATKPQLHFELRKDSKPVDPEQYFSRS